MKSTAKEILAELRRIHDLSPTDIALEWQKDRNFPLPSMLARGDGHGTIISPKVENLILDLRKKYSQKKPALKSIYKASELHKLLRNALGLSLASMDMSQGDDDNADKIISALDKAIEDQLQSFEDAEHIFGCTLFMKVKTPTFSIGPVCFEERNAWLERKKADGGLSPVTYKRIQQKWSGKRLRKRNIRNEDAWMEQYICGAIDDAPYVCSVAVKALPPETGREKALVAARLALTTISLAWIAPSSVLDGLRLNYDGQPYMRKTVSFSKRGMIGGGDKWSSTHLHGVNIKSSADWDNTLQQSQNIFSLCGSVIEHALTPAGSPNRPKVLNAFLHALIWFHAGCREEDNLIAVVKYAACLDALTGEGGKAVGIQRLIEKQLGVSNDKTIFKNDTRTVKEVVEEIYGSGRSRTIHGNNDSLGHDWTTTRSEAELLSRLCLVNCLFHAAGDASLADPKSFMAARRTKKAKSRKS